MEIKNIVEYVVNTPGNTNGRILEQMINEIAQSGSDTVPLYYDVNLQNGEDLTTIQKKTELASGTLITADILNTLLSNETSLYPGASKWTDASPYWSPEPQSQVPVSMDNPWPEQGTMNIYTGLKLKAIIGGIGEQIDYLYSFIVGESLEDKIDEIEAEVTSSYPNYQLFAILDNTGKQYSRTDIINQDFPVELNVTFIPRPAPN